MPESIMRKRAKRKKLSLQDRRDVLEAEMMVNDHESYSSEEERQDKVSKSRMEKIKKPKQYMRQGRKYDLYYQESPTKLMRKRNKSK